MSFDDFAKKMQDIHSMTQLSPAMLDAVRPPPPLHVSAFESLVARVREFEASLSDTEAVGVMLASFGSAVHLQLTSLSRSGQFICLEGKTEDGGEATLVQHYTQTSILLMKIKPVLDSPRRPIGFSAS